MTASEARGTVGGLGKGGGMATLHVDCNSCTVRGDACSDCVISVLLAPPAVGFEESEQRALTVLADAGLVPPLRLNTPGDGVQRAV